MAKIEVQYQMLESEKEDNPHYKEMQTEQENNYEAKVVLCEKAEELVHSHNKFLVA